ncbi:hypothetical protein HQ447_00400 [bacterium]|nr:hypothetical protein [bacterium]
MSIPRQIPLLVVLLGIVTSLHAMPIRFLAWDDDIAARKIGFSNGTEVAEVQDLHPQKRSKTISWTNSGVPPVLVALDRKSPEGKPVTAPIKLTPDLKSPLVVLLPDPTHPSGLRGFVIEDSAGNFAWGTFRFINATGKELLVRNDKVTKSLPETWKAVDLDPGGEARNMGVQMASRKNLNEILYSAVWEYDPNFRKLIIIVPGTDAQSGPIILKVIPEDRRAVVAPAPAAGGQTP